MVRTRLIMQDPKNSPRVELFEPCFWFIRPQLTDEHKRKIVDLHKNVYYSVWRFVNLSSFRTVQKIYESV